MTDIDSHPDGKSLPAWREDRQVRINNRRPSTARNFSPTTWFSSTWKCLDFWPFPAMHCLRPAGKRFDFLLAGHEYLEACRESSRQTCRQWSWNRWPNSPKWSTLIGGKVRWHCVQCSGQSPAHPTRFDGHPPCCPCPATAGQTCNASLPRQYNQLDRIGSWWRRQPSPAIQCLCSFRSDKFVPAERPKCGSSCWPAPIHSHPCMCSWCYSNHRSTTLELTDDRLEHR